MVTLSLRLSKGQDGLRSLDSQGKQNVLRFRDATCIMTPVNRRELRTSLDRRGQARRRPGRDGQGRAQDRRRL